MSATEIDELGPVDYLVVEFPAGKSNFSARTAAVVGTAAVVSHGVDRRQDRRENRRDRRQDHGVRR